jgi:hypothetical protein
MASKDTFNNIHPVIAIAPITISDGTALVSGAIDTAGYESVTFVIQTGTLADARGQLPSRTVTPPLRATTQRLTTSSCLGLRPRPALPSATTARLARSATLAASVTFRSRSTTLLPIRVPLRLLSWPSWPTPALYRPRRCRNDAPGCEAVFAFVERPHAH